MAHIDDGPLKKGGEQLPFLRGEILHQFFLIAENNAVHGFMALDALGKNIDPLAAAVNRVRAQLQEALLLQTGQKAGDSGVAQAQGGFNIPGTGGLGLPGQITHDVALCCGELHFFQSVGYGLVHTPVQDPQKMAIMRGQIDHLQKCSLLPISVAQAGAGCKGLRKKFTNTGVGSRCCTFGCSNTLRVKGWLKMGKRHGTSITQRIRRGQVRRKDVVRRLAELAYGNCNDCVRLVLEDQLDLQALDLSLLSEVKRNEKGTVEVRLLDRLRILEQLERLTGEESMGMEAFLKGLEGGEEA